MRVLQGGLVTRQNNYPRLLWPKTPTRPPSVTMGGPQRPTHTPLKVHRCVQIAFSLFEQLPLSVFHWTIYRYIHTVKRNQTALCTITQFKTAGACGEYIQSMFDKRQKVRRERGRETDRQTDRQRDRADTDRQTKNRQIYCRWRCHQFTIFPFQSASDSQSFLNQEIRSFARLVTRPSAGVCQAWRAHWVK